MTAKFNKLIRILLILFLIVFAGFTYASPQKIIVTNSNSWIPYSFINTKGEPDGLFTEIWRTAAAKNNFNVEFKLVNWKESIELIKTGQADIHSGLFRNEEREKFLEYGPPLAFPMPTKLIVSKKLAISGLNELGNVSVGLIEAGYAEYFLKKNFPDVKVRTFANAQLLLEAAINEEILAFITEYPTAYSYFRKFEASDKFNVLETLYEKRTAFAVKKGRKDLIEFATSANKKITFAGLDKIIGKWTLTEYQTPIWVLWGIGVFAAIVVVVFVAGYIFMLHKSKKELELKVAERTKELTNKNEELQAAIADIKTLSGILPICASCKKIRDGEGYWKQVEAYISEHSAAQFSHGLCGPCVKKLYGDEDWYKDSKEAFDE